MRARAQRRPRDSSKLENNIFYDRNETSGMFYFRTVANINRGAGLRHVEKKERFKQKFSNFLPKL